MAKLHDMRLKLLIQQEHERISKSQPKDLDLSIVQARCLCWLSLLAEAHEDQANDAEKRGDAEQAMGWFADSMRLRDVITLVTSIEIPLPDGPDSLDENDELLVVASERPVIQTVFNAPLKSIKELEPGHAILTKKSGMVSIEKIQEPLTKKQCSFERIYFSRGSDASIYKERKKLGNNLFPQIMKSINNDIEKLEILVDTLRSQAKDKFDMQVEIGTVKKLKKKKKN